jgi:hypothetical protein
MQSDANQSSELLWLSDRATKPMAAISNPTANITGLGRLLESIPAWITGVFLFVVGALLFIPWRRLEEHPVLQEVAPRLGEALVIAGILALLVDPFLKARLQRDAARSIFEHMLGFDHEPELKAKLRDIVFNTTLYRRDFKLCCDITSATDSPEMVQLFLTSEYEVFNPSLEKKRYQVPLKFVSAERPADCEVTQIIGDEQPEVSHPTLKETDSGYVAANTSEMALEPLSKGNRYRFIAKCRCEAPQNWFHSVHFGFPTIDAVITVKAPEGWSVWVGGQEDKRQSSARWHNVGLFMPGDKVEIHWRKPDFIQCGSAIQDSS